MESSNAKIVFKTDDNKYIVEKENGVYSLTEKLSLASLYSPNQLSNEQLSRLEFEFTRCLKRHVKIVFVDLVERTKNLESTLMGLRIILGVSILGLIAIFFTPVYFFPPKDNFTWFLILLVWIYFFVSLYFYPKGLAWKEKKNAKIRE